MLILGKTGNGFIVEIGKYEMSGLCGQRADGHLDVGTKININAMFSSLEQIKNNKEIPNVARRLRALAELIEAEGPFIEGLSDVVKEADNV